MSMTTIAEKLEAKGLMALADFVEPGKETA